MGCFGGRTLADRSCDQKLVRVGKRKPAGSNHRSELLETHFVEEGVQSFDGAAQISHTLIERLDLLFQLRNALAVRDWRS